MSDAPDEAQADAKKALPAAKGKKGGKGRLLLFAGGGLVLLLALLGGAYVALPAVSGPVNAMLGIGGGEAAHDEHQAAALPAAAPEASRPVFIEMPEINVTLPNGGRPRQLRITLAVEIMGDPILLRPTVNNPRVYDSLLLYLRTLRDSELEGALALDRLRGDLYRRVDLLLGPGVVRDVLITGLIIA